MDERDPFEALCETLKLAISALRDAGVAFALAGSLAAWARGGPQPEKDVDLMVAPGDAEAALAALAEAGMRAERPPEEWLLKAWHGAVLVDVIFAPAGAQSSEAILERADTLAVLSVATPVIAIEDMLATKLSSLDEHALDYAAPLAIARSLREQIEWPRLRALTAESPFAKAFFTLVEELGVAPRAGAGSGRGATSARVVSSSG
ncbi:MAG TPA: hypothetical protein VG186_14880 [Solirubrobacteraceae bacterium]|jgi:hypothetical protein|nr:hypothetical protein [Solirubrobacteraceae bacterium]